MSSSFKTHELAVGYNKNILIQNINIQLVPGTILTLIGPNGAGKSTILKTITRQLAALSGNIFVGGSSIDKLSGKEFAKKVSVVLTERIDPELMTCAEVVAMGRYPYTDMFGNLSERDKEIVLDSIKLVHASELASRLFNTLSDGQRQRIMLARAICQEPEIIVLDEPTAYLDIRYKIELLDILQKMARDKGTIVIMSLHEIDLAMKISDEIMCLDGEEIVAYGSTETVFSDRIVEKLFGISNGTYNQLFGSIEMPMLEKEPEVFVIGGNGSGTPVYRAFQRKGIPFATGILFENDVDTHTAVSLTRHVVIAQAFEPISYEEIETAKQFLQHCRFVLNPGAKIGPLNQANAALLAFAAEKNIPVFGKIEEVPI